MDYIIGVDFDNTLISYDDVIYHVALEKGLISSGTRKNKKDVRDRIRQLPDGETQWQRLQAIVYGPRIGEGRLIDGVEIFFEHCKHHQVRVYIVSHKTEYANFDETRTNLRMAALTWMTKNRFFETDGLGLSQEAVYFESTRPEKIERIKYLQCTHFIDDLEEIFLEDSFPTNVEKVLYTPHMQHSSLGRVKTATNWKEISNYCFSTRR